MSQTSIASLSLATSRSCSRGWSGFSNFAISFSIICVLAGCFTTYGQALKNGGPIAISIAWPLISMLILAVAFSMSELASALPTAGGIYYWASKLGGAGWGWFTGWFNLIGLVAVVASVDYVCATFLMNLLGLYNVHFIFNFAKAAAATDVHYIGARELRAVRGDPDRARPDQRVLEPPGGDCSRRSRCGGTWSACAVIVVILIAVPSHHASLSYVFGHRDERVGLRRSHVLVLRAAARLPADDVHDHRLRRLGARLRGDARRRTTRRAKGVWRSVFYSAVIGWIVLLAITFAIQKSHEARNPQSGLSRRSTIFPRRSARRRPRR